MANYGVTAQGFIRKRLPEIKADLEAAFTAAFGAINLEPDSVFGIFIGLLAESLALLWERNEQIYQSQYPASAEDFSLDGVCNLTGITRLSGTHTTVPAALWGTIGTIIPAGTQASVETTAELFSSQQEKTIQSYSNTGAAQMTVKSAVASTTYTITIDETDFSFITGDPAETVAQIATGLAAAINAAPDPFAAYAAGAVVTVLGESTSQTFEIFTNNPSNQLELTAVGAHIDFEAINLGAVLALAGTLNQIETPVSGLSGIENYTDGLLGQSAETDIELRARRLQSLTMAGAATLESIRSHILQDIEDVTAAFFDENRTDVTVGDLTPHSFELIVQGGDDQEIADALWQLKPAGIQTIGTEDVEVTDSQGQTQLMHFSRPTPVLVWIDVRMTANSEEQFPTPEADGFLAIKQAILALGQESNVGEDVIIQKFFAAVYSVPGVASATITRATGGTPGSPPYGSSANISIAAHEIATFSLSRITVAWAV